MKKIFIIGLFISFLVTAPTVFAHPGRTDSSGCHTCRTNCPDWGLSYGEYHCHNGGYVAPPVQQYQAPATSTPKPTYKPLPTATPTPKPSPTNTSTPTPSPEPEVRGIESPPTVQLTSKSTETSTGDAILGLGILGALAGGGFWVGKKILNKFRGSKDGNN